MARSLGRAREAGWFGHPLALCPFGVKFYDIFGSPGSWSRVQVGRAFVSLDPAVHG